MGTTLQKPDGVFQRVTLFFTLYPKDDKRIISYPIDTLSDTKIRDSSPKSEDEIPSSSWSEVRYWSWGSQLAVTWDRTSFFFGEAQNLMNRQREKSFPPSPPKKKKEGPPDRRLLSIGIF